MFDNIQYTGELVGPKDLYRIPTIKIKSDWHKVDFSKHGMPFSQFEEMNWKKLEMVTWCNKNCTGRWSVEAISIPIFYFKTTRDRLAFVLVWC